MNRLVVISGCSGGGKSTLLVELKRRGYTVVEEPGRRVVHAEMQNGGVALPWMDLKSFLQKVMQLALVDIAALGSPGDWVFFDRSLIDAFIGLKNLTGKLPSTTRELSDLYNPQVFMAPPWPEIYVQDEERQHGIDAAMQEYFRLINEYPSLGYSVSILPKAEVADRADFILHRLVG